MSSSSEKRVLVTGGNGFIGTHLISLLLQNKSQSYTIHVTHHPSTSPSHLLSLPNASPRRIRLFPADLLDAEAIAAAAEGCTAGVFHVASPCTLEEVGEDEVVGPALTGTMNVLEAARMCQAKRVVVTSSISAMVPNLKWKGVVDERCWTDLDYCIQKKKWYPVSKTLAEKKAWEYAEKYNMDIVVINPSTCLGPLLQPDLNASSAVLQQLLQGSEDTQEYHWLGSVHVRDVAAAQILLLETPEASGRHLCTNGIYQFKDFAELVAKLCPEYNVHRFTGETQPGLVPCKDAAKKLIDLGLVFTPIEEAIEEAVASLKEHGFIRQLNLQA